MFKKLIVAFVIGLSVFAGTTTEAKAANFIVGCLASHTNNDDPIVFPGQVGASHNHTFVGARTTNAFSTFDSLVASQTTCGTPGDRSGYWQPTWYPVHPNKGLLVYMNVTSQTQVFPDGLKIIIRHSGGRIKFKCGPGSGTETLAPPAKCDSGMLVAVIEFPRWWNGRDLDSADHLSHMSYSRTSTHNVELPRMKWYFRMSVPVGQPINPNNAAGSYQNYHVDFFDGWVKADLQRLMQQCLNINCGTNPQ